MIQFYGAPMSSSGRTHLMLEEVGVPYQYNRTNLRDPAVKAEYLKINPAGRIPYIVDGDFTMSESAAINFYLAEKYKPEMLPPSQMMRILEWSFWAMTNLQPEALSVMFAMMGRGTPEKAAEGKERCKALLADLESKVGDFLVGDTFTVADVNVGSVVNLALRVSAGEGGPKTTAWIERLRARPAWQRVAAAG